MSGNKAEYLRKVYLSADVFAVCLHHAFTTEKEEIMGLLIGEVDEENGVSNITACFTLNRSDKQPDRVEISPTQLCSASSKAEILAQELKRPMRVLGWYHSHPHITVWPSHVDIRTQAMYQTMDPLFVGLIFSVYSREMGSHTNHVTLICFQSQETYSNLQSREIEVVIKASPFEAYNLKGVADLPNILVEEEIESHSPNDKKTNDILTKLHNDALKTQALVHIISKIAIPTCETLEGRLNTTKNRIKMLKALKQKLISGIGP
ncbi:lys-63-specific deubiquitinase BRCC36 [Agrilus planipennis]|uniref:Lys-63-specific deubiquitinase BRCC36 n=1 Tax=Agrilus planipennis TaxID=224129 RepID=A0A1W4WE61_AGRPL|nr:lys-63-specific deubiquitinase BRCC36 [Agrilus planipennis]